MIDTNESKSNCLHFITFDLDRLLLINQHYIMDSISKLTTRTNIPYRSNGKNILKQVEFYDCYITIDKIGKMFLYSKKRNNYPDPYNWNSVRDLIEPFHIEFECSNKSPKKLVTEVITKVCHFLNSQAELSDKQLYELDPDDRLFSDIDYIDWLFPERIFELSKIENSNISFNYNLRFKNPCSINYLIKKLLSQSNIDDIIQDYQISNLLSSCLWYYDMMDANANNYMTVILINKLIQTFKNHKGDNDQKIKDLTEIKDRIQKEGY